MILLTGLAILPLLLTRTVGIRVMDRFSESIITRIRAKIISDAEERLQLVVSTAAELLKSKADMLEMAVTAQAREAAIRIGRGDPGEASSRRRMGRGRGTPPEPVDTTSDRQLLISPSGDESLSEGPDAGWMKGMTQVYRDLSGSVDRLPLWQITALSDGWTSVYSHRHAIRPRPDIRRQPWYDAAMASPKTVWVPEFSDPETGQMVIAVAKRFGRSTDRPEGATAMIVPISSLMVHPGLFRNAPDGSSALLVVLTRNNDTGRLDARIAAGGRHPAASDAPWISPMETGWLRSENAARFAEVLEDFKAGTENVRRLPYEGEDALWVYGPLSFKLFLVLIAPSAAIDRHADQAEETFQGMIDAALAQTWIALMASALIAVVVALAFSRTVTRPLQTLADGAIKLAGGQFDTQVEVRSSDEFGDLGRLFNQVGPELKRHQDIRQSLDLAREIQQNLLPADAPIVDGVSIAGKSAYCDETGGDFFDYTAPRGFSAGVVVADVSDHGIPSALLMATVRASLRQRSAMPGPMEAIVRDVNRQICLDVKDSGQFVTLFFGAFTEDGRGFQWVNAGHDPALCYDPRTDRFTEFAGGGLPLGVDENAAYRSHRTRLDPGQLILIGTDGIWESRNTKGIPYGKEGFRSLVRSHAANPPQAIVDAVFEDLRQFRKSASAEDDVTLVVIKLS
ncbi:MAG: SpoIIE family protein phosphatase [Desulfobacterales bacterium]